MEQTKFIPDDFEIPSIYETDFFRLRMLSVEDVEKDYEAVMESRALLQSLFGGDWPSECFTQQENLRDLERHQKEFLKRQAFAYTVVSLDEERVLGCLYINPPKRRKLDSGVPPDVDAVVHMWVRQSEFDRGLDPILFETVKQWLKREWPFEKVSYPERE